MQSLHLNLQFKGYGYIVEVDIKGFFNNIDHQWLKARIKTPVGRFEKPVSGTPEGGMISPVLANIYLHYALDLWFEKRVNHA
jgi:retron-type reverse transcriptase